MRKATLILMAMLILFCNLVNATPSEHKMKDNKLTVIIHKPLQEVFAFTTDPHKTPEWIDSIQVEETNTWPPKLGTIYRNHGKTGPWSVYKVTKYVKEKEFELVKQDGSTYHVNYTYSTDQDGATKLVYHEWVTKGELDGPFTQGTLDNLKRILEKKR